MPRRYRHKDVNGVEYEVLSRANGSVVIERMHPMQHSGVWTLGESAFAANFVAVSLSVQDALAACRTIIDSTDLGQWTDADVGALMAMVAQQKTPA